MKIKIIISFISIFLFFRCSESNLTPNEIDEDYYFNLYGATSEDISLQKSFFTSTGIYLVFNDTLKKVLIGKDYYGNEIYEYELVDIPYNLSGYIGRTNIFEYDYLQTITEKKSAVDFVEDGILPYLAESLKPFSVFLVNQINQYTWVSIDDYNLSHPMVYSGWRSIAIATGGIDEMTDEETFIYRMSILKTFVDNKIPTVTEDVFEEFYSYCSHLYGNYWLYPEENYPEMFDLSDVRTNGVLTAWGYNTITANFKAKEYDRDDFINLVFSGTEEEILADNADFPIVIKKYYLMKEIIKDMGVVL